ncbi:MAG: hypothetical protein JRI28_03855 [Deltaproteobacteria bacterium]|nr:hypothetical protein [Deltaproteobacteria bacterium]
MKFKFEKKWLSMGSGHLEIIHVRTETPRAIVFAPPLIGGNLSQQVRYFRSLISFGYDLVTFTYRGHGKSQGKFSLGTTLKDTVFVLDHTCRLAENENLPIFGIGSCAAALPLLYSAGWRPMAFSKIVLINAITQIRLSSIFKSFFAYYRIIFRHQNKRYNMMDALRSYWDFMLPEVSRHKGTFGELALKRTKPLKIFHETLAWNPLDKLRLNDLPVLCLYSRDDRILKLYEALSESHYRAKIKRICPQVRFSPLEGDHFLSQPDVRCKALKCILTFFRQASD